jgi:hypothetical protein
MYRIAVKPRGIFESLLALKGALCATASALAEFHSSAVDSVTAARLVCLACDVGLRAPVERAVGYGVLAKVAAAGLAAWLLEDVWSRSAVAGVAAAAPVAQSEGMNAGEPRKPSLAQ